MVYSNWFKISFTLLPFGAMAQQNPTNPTITASKCKPDDGIQVRITPFENGKTYEISRSPEKKNDFKVIGRLSKNALHSENEGVFSDRTKDALTGLYYDYKVGQSNIAAGYVCLQASVMPILPYYPLRKSIQNIDFQWSALQGIEQYQVQVARNRDEWSFVTGFKTTLLDTVIRSNELNWLSPAQAGDTLYWSVKPMMAESLPVNTTGSYFMEPIKIAISLSKPFSSLPTSNGLIKVALSMKRNKTTIRFKNTDLKSLKNIQLHYFISDTNVFTPQARLLMTQHVPKIMPNASLKLSQQLYFKDLKGFILIVPSIEGVFLGERQVWVQPIR